MRGDPTTTKPHKIWLPKTIIFVDFSPIVVLGCELSLLITGMRGDLLGVMIFGINILIFHIKINQFSS